VTALILGTALAVVALCFVLWPLLVPPTVRTASPSAFPSSPDYAVEALRELEFDRATGKISDTDYTALKATYTRKALRMMRAGDRFVCEKCGPRPEPDAVFCSTCGASLAA
jgi:ribosomal protein L40E